MNQPEQAVTLDAAALDKIIQGVIAGLRPMIDRPPQRFLGVDDAAHRIGVSPESVRKLLDTGKLTRLRPVRGRVVIDVIELDSLVLSSDAQPRKGRGIRSA